MKRLGLAFLITSAAALYAGPSRADADDRFYATALVGIGFLGSETISYRDEAISSEAKANFDLSFTGGGTLGYNLNDQWRLETEIVYRRNDLNDITVEGIGSSTEGDFASLNIGISALYNFKPFQNDKLTGYMGAGIMLTQEIDIDFEINGEETSFETDDVGFQLQFGGRYDFSEKLFVDAGVRYLSVSGTKLEFPGDSRRTVESDYSPISVSLGVGWRF